MIERTGRPVIRLVFLAIDDADLQRMIDSTPEGNCGMMTVQVMTLE